ncbi:MAG: discoidin domain-containing protein, partial [Clostridia bacterium]|nr:discoidin domain-containing protein [Clostridia bacterium]
LSAMPDGTPIIDLIRRDMLDNGYEITSSDPTVLGINGTVTRATEDKNVSLTVSGKKDGICFSKTYNFIVKAGANQGGSSGGEEEDNTPDWLKDIVSGVTEEKLIANYNFTGGNKPWENVPNNFPTDATDPSKEFVGEYTTEGFKITKLQDGNTDNSGKATSYYGRINFVKVTDEATLSYESGFKGQYVVDLTYKQNMVKAPENTAKNPPRLDMAIGFNADISANKNSSLANYVRYTSGAVFKVYDNQTSNAKDYIAGGVANVDARNADVVQRIVIDTDAKRIAHYNYVDDKYVYVGSGEYFGDSVQGMQFNPRLGFAKDSYFTYKSVKIYEVKKTAEPLIVVDGTVPGPGEGGSGDGEGGSGDDTEDVIPEWVNDAVSKVAPEKLVSDYTFKNSNVPGEFIPNDFADTPHFSAEYTDEGFVLTKLTTPTDDDRSATIDQRGKLNLVIGLGKDDVNKTGTYQFGLVGTYVVDLYVNSNLSMNLEGKQARFDWTFSGSTDISSSAASGSYATVRVTSGASGNPFQVYGPVIGSYPNAVSKTLSKGTDTVVRLVVDTKAGAMAYYVQQDGKFVFAGNGDYSGDILQCIRFSPRLGFAAGSTFTFKGVKIYEIERYVNEANGMEDRNFQVTETIKDTSIFPEFIVGNPNAVTDSFTLSGTDWTTSNEKMVTTAGNVFRGYDDEIVTLRKQFVTNVTPALVVFKDYDLNVLKRPDVVNEAIGTHDFKTEVEGVVYADKANTEVTSEGLVIKNPGNSIIVPVKRYVASDSTSSTYVNNLNGVFDYEFDITPSVAKKYDEGGKPVTIESGYYDAATGSFTSYASFNIYNGIAYYKTNATGFTAVKVANDASNIIKIRTDSVKNKIWIYVNGVRSNELEYMGNGYVNAYRVSVNEGAEASDKITVKSTNITSLFEFENRNFADSAINACVNKVAELVMSKVTSKPEDAYGPMGDLPETLGDYKVEWTVDSDYVDLAEKYAYAYEQKQNVVVTAKVYDSGNSNVFVTKEFYIVIKETNDPVILLESTTSKLAARFITNQNAGNIITDIVLPETLEGNTVVWTSSDDTLISSKGVVNKNEKDISEPTAVTLTAVVSNGTTEVTKKVNFTVAKQGKDITLYTNSASIETPITGVVTYEADLNGAATLKDSNGKKIIELNETGAIKVVMDFNNSKVSVFKDGVLITDYVDFAEAAENFKAVESSNVTNEKIILDEYELYNYNVEKFNLLDELRKGFITGNITLGETTIGGAVVTWDSENTAILDNSGNFIAPENVMFFDVNFSITLPGGTGATYTEKLNMVAVPKNNIFAGGTYVNQGTSVPAAQYYTSLMFDGNYSDTMFRGAYANSTKSIVIDMQNVQDINTLYISNDGIKSLDVYVSDDNVDWKLVAQPVFDGSKEKNLVVFETENTRYVKISNISYDGAYVDIYEIGGFTVYDSSDKSYLDILAIVLPENYVLDVSSLTLPSTGAYGSTFVWTSSNPQIISTTGVVSKPVYDTEVLLTVTSTNGTASSTKTYRYLVKGAQGGQGGIPSGGGSGGGAGAGGTFMG